jgi:integrase
MYRQWLEDSGERLGWPDPANITLRQLESLEAEYMATYAQCTVTEKMSILRDMLRTIGNKDALRYKLLSSMQPAKDSVYLTEEQVARLRLLSRQLSNVHELIYSLMVDNGLRPVDIQRLTVSNARELLDTGESMILGKGRNGGKVAKLVLSPMTRAPLLKYLEARKKMDGSDAMPHLMLHVFQCKTIRMSHQYIWLRTKETFAEAGMDAKCRDLRKTCGNRVYKLTRDVAMSAMILRHSSPGTTFRHYIGADSVEMRDVQARLAKIPESLSQED